MVEESRGYLFGANSAFLTAYGRWNTIDSSSTNNILCKKRKAYRILAVVIILLIAELRILTAQRFMMQN